MRSFKYTRHEGLGAMIWYEKVWGRVGYRVRAGMKHIWHVGSPLQAKLMYGLGVGGNLVALLV